MGKENRGGGHPPRFLGSLCAPRAATEVETHLKSEGGEKQIDHRNSGVGKLFSKNFSVFCFLTQDVLIIIGHGTSLFLTDSNSSATFIRVESGVAGNRFFRHFVLTGVESNHDSTLVSGEANRVGIRSGD